MKHKFFVTLETGYVGSTAYELLELEDNELPFIDDYCYDLAMQNYDQYGFESDEELEDGEVPYGVEWHYLPYVPEEHDPYLY